MFFYFKVSSKNDQILSRFSKFLIKLENLPATIKQFSKQNKKKFVTILKSPHVNKTAQEQFEFRFFSKEFLLSSAKPLTTFMILKKITNLSFPGIKLEVKSFLHIEERKRSVLRVINPDSIILDKNCTIVSKNIIAQKKYIQLFDCYGESYLQTLSYLRKKNMFR